MPRRPKPYKCPECRVSFDVEITPEHGFIEFGPGLGYRDCPGVGQPTVPNPRYQED